MLTEKWNKATKSNPSGNCLEAKWKTASKSNGNGGMNCVEAQKNELTGYVQVRDTKQQGRGPILEFTPEQWTYLLGKFQEHGMGWPDRDMEFYVVEKHGVKLRFTESEWDAFIDGVLKGEFALPEKVGV